MLDRGKTALFCMAVVLHLMAPRPALAEGEIPDLRKHEASASRGLHLPAVRKTLGLDAAGFIFKPELTFSSEYNTNLFYADQFDPARPVDAWLIKMIPSLGFQSPRHSVLVVNAQGAVEARKYFHNRETVTRQSMFGGVAGLNATFFPRSVVSLTLHEDFRRVLERRNFETTSSWEPALSTSMIY